MQSLDRRDYLISLIYTICFVAVLLIGQIELKIFVVGVHIGNGLLWGTVFYRRYGDRVLALLFVFIWAFVPLICWVIERDKKV